MSLTEVFEKLQVNATQLAEKFDPPISRQAVFYWKTTGIPKLRQYEIKDMINDSNT